MYKYTHIFSLDFSLGSNCRNGNDVKVEDVMDAIRRRMMDITPETFMEVIGSPNETGANQD